MVVAVLRVAGPHEPDLEPGCVAETLAPARASSGSAARYGTSARDRAEIDAERARHAQQRAVQVEAGQRLAALDAGRTRPRASGRDHARRLARHLEQDLRRAEALDDRRVARELDRVAEPLLDVQQDRLADQRVEPFHSGGAKGRYAIPGRCQRHS